MAVLLFKGMKLCDEVWVASGSVLLSSDMAPTNPNSEVEYSYNSLLYSKNSLLVRNIIVGKTLI